jgi:cbb3-type cytochrome oxidase maturation protein
MFVFDCRHLTRKIATVALWCKKLIISMSAFFLLIGASILVAVGFLIAFLWSVNNGQYDDDYTPSVRMLFDDEIEK